MSSRFPSGLFPGERTWGKSLAILKRSDSDYLKRYGGPAPRLTGSLALDLHRMNKIIEINEEFSYAVVEPGVTFTDLYDYCKLHRYRVWPSVPSLGWGSVIGNVRLTLEFTFFALADP